MQGTFPSQQQPKQNNINPPIISLSKFPRKSFTKLKIKTKNMNIHKLKIPPIQTHSFVINENKQNIQQSKLPPLINNTSSNLNYRSKTPLSLTNTRKLNDINSSINIFNKNRWYHEYNPFVLYTNKYMEEWIFCCPKKEEKRCKSK